MGRMVGGGSLSDQVMSKLAFKNGKGWAGINRQNTKDFQGSENTLYDTITIDTCYYTLVLTCRMYRSESTLLPWLMWLSRLSAGL